MFADGFDNRAFFDAVTAAHFGIIRQIGRTAFACVAAVAGLAFAEHQVVAHFGDVAAFTHQLEVPRAIGGVAIQARANQLVGFDHQLFIHAAHRVGQDDVFAAVIAGKVARREQINAGDFQLGRGDRALVAANPKACQVVGGHAGLFVERGDKAIGGATVVGAFPHGVDAGVVGLQGVADHNAAIAIQPTGFGQLGIGAYPCGHNDQICRNLVAVFKAHGFDPPAVVADKLGGVFGQQEVQPTVFERLLQQLAGGVV